MKRNKGITLIALVVTIVVLLILAGISISMLGGENGIITKAQEAKEENRGGTVEERRDLWKANQKSSPTSSDEKFSTAFRHKSNSNPFPARCLKSFCKVSLSALRFFINFSAALKTASS